MSEVPGQVEDIVRHREWTQAALDRAVAPFGGEPEPDRPASRAEAFTRHIAEQRQQEELREALVRQAMFENPDPPLDEPTRCALTRWRSAPAAAGAEAACAGQDSEKRV